MNSELQNVGPISTFELEKLRDFFKANNIITFEIEIDGDLKAAADEQMRIQGNGQFDPLTRRAVGTFDFNQAQFFYVYLEAESALKAKAFLNDLSLTLNRKNAGVADDSAQELLEAEDYMCIDCGYHSEQPGVCPKDAVVLLPYFEWIKAKRDREIIGSQSMTQLILISVVVGALALAIYKVIANK